MSHQGGVGIEVEFVGCGELCLTTRPCELVSNVDSLWSRLVRAIAHLTASNACSYKDTALHIYYTTKAMEDTVVLAVDNTLRFPRPMNLGQVEAFRLLHSPYPLLGVSLHLTAGAAHSESESVIREPLMQSP